MKQKMNFEQGNAGKNLLKMVVPLFMAMILMLAYNLVDSIWVGNLLGENGYAALTAASSISMILYAMTTGVGNGTSVLVSQLVGAKNRERTERVIVTAIVVSAGIAIGVTGILELCLNPILAAFGTPEIIYEDARSYLAVFLIGYVAIFLYMQLTSIYRSFGDPVFQMKGMLLGTLINMIVDPLFIRALGILGAAIATVLSQVLCLLFAILYGKKKGYFSFQLHYFDNKEILPILKTILPTSVQNLTPAISSMIMVILVNAFDVTTIAAYGVVKNVETILFYPAMAMNMALITIVGQLYGAKCSSKIREYRKVALLYGCLIEAILTVLVLLFSTQLSMLFVKELAVAAIVSRGLKMIGIGYLCYMMTNIYTANLAGIGKVQLSMGLMFLYYIVIRVPLAIALVHTALQLDGMWIAILASHVIAVLFAWVAEQRKIGPADRTGMAVVSSK